MKIFTQTLKIFTLATALFGMSAGVMGQTVVLSENFDKFIQGEANSAAHSTDVSGSLDTYTQTTGWSGSRVYQAGGAIKIGASKTPLGYIQTPEINLSGNNGDFTIEFKAMAWEGDATEINIYMRIKS